ncbi:MAG: hypothetical protein ACKO6Q_04280 [Bacteroidota bacterium]
MKFLISTVAIACLSFLSGVYFAWWSFAVPALIIGLLIPQKGIRNFFSGFIGVFGLWVGLTYWIDSANGGILSNRMAQILPVGGNVLYLHLLTAAVGGLIGGLAALTGKYVRSLIPAPTH